MTKRPWKLWHRKIWKIKNDSNHNKTIYFWKASKKTIILKQQRKKSRVFVKHYSMPPGSNKVQKAIFSFKVKVNVIDLGVIWKGIISGVCMPNIKSLSLTVQKLKRRLKLTTDRQTDRTKTICPRSFDPRHKNPTTNKKVMAKKNFD